MSNILQWESSSDSQGMVSKTKHLRVKSKPVHIFKTPRWHWNATQVLWISLHYKDDNFISNMTFKKTEMTEKMQSTALDDGFTPQTLRKQAIKMHTTETSNTTYKTGSKQHIFVPQQMICAPLHSFTANEGTKTIKICCLCHQALWTLL